MHQIRKNKVFEKTCAVVPNHVRLKVFTAHEYSTIIKKRPKLLSIITTLQKSTNFLHCMLCIFSLTGL